MRITELCVGCGICVPYCYVGAISVDREKRRAVIDYDKCGFCNICVREAPCPVEGALVEIPFEELTGPQKIAREINEIATRRLAAGVAIVSGCIHNQHAPEIRPGEVGVSIDVGRPMVYATLGEVQEVVKMFTDAGFKVKPGHRFPSMEGHTSYAGGLSGFRRDLAEGKLPEEILKLRILLKFGVGVKVKQEEFPKLLDQLRDFSQRSNKVITTTLMSIVEEDGSIPLTKVLDDKGVKWTPTGETLITNPKLPFQVEGGKE